MPRVAVPFRVVECPEQSVLFRATLVGVDRPGCSVLLKARVSCPRRSTLSQVALLGADRLGQRVLRRVALEVMSHLGLGVLLRAVLEEVGHLGQRALLRVALEEVERSGRRVLSTGAVPPKGPTRPIRSILLRVVAGPERVDHLGREVLLEAALAERHRLAPGLAADSMEQADVQPSEVLVETVVCFLALGAVGYGIMPLGFLRIWF